MKTNKERQKVFFKHFTKLFLAWGCSFVVSITAFANPVLNNIGSGNVTIQQAPSSTIINQTSQKAIINWKSFNIGSQENTHFNQPAGGVALNRISPQQGASQIYGRLTATGQIILVNPAGIYFGPSAYVNVGGLIATTANIADENFLSGNYIFNQPSPFSGASIINEGTIIAAQQGLVALVGSNVTNNGMIQADYGNVVLASGKAFTMSFAGNDMIHFAVTESADAGGKVTNEGSLIANAGRIQVTAKQASAVLDNVINMKGVVEAKSVYQRNGEIIISGDTKGGVVKVASKIRATGKAKGERGGNVIITGHNILLDSTAEIDVSGDTGAGNVNIGGNYQGQGPLPNANAVVMMPGAAIYADALTNGNGGNVILWADNVTKAYGKILARGGSEGGNGGFLETSGKVYLDVNGIEVNTSALFGSAGTWLLDPTNIYIANNQVNATLAGMSGVDSSINSSGPSVFNASGAVQDSLLLVSTLQNALTSNNVAVNTTNASGTGLGNITVVDPITWSSSFQLNLNAANNILINAAITTGSGSLLILNVGNTGSQTAAIGGSGSLFKSGAGTFNLSQANTYTGSTSVTAGTLSVQNASGLSGSGVFISSGATLEIANGLTISGINISSLNGTGVSGNGALRCLGSCTWNGSVTASTATVTSNTAASTFSLTGLISLFTTQTLTFDGAGNFSVSGSGIAGTPGNIVKNGSGTLTLSSTNTYTGSTTVNAGILEVQNSSALGTTGGATTVASGAVLQISGSALSIAEPITLNGTGISSGGVLRNLANSNTWSGAITLGTAASIASDAGTLTLTGGISGTGLALTTSGAGNITISSNAITTGAGGTLTKNGTGTLSLSTANTYDGLTTVNAGIIDVQNNTGLGTTAGATTVASGAAIQINGSGLNIAEPLNTLIGTGVSSGGGLRNLANNNTWSGAITLGVGGATINSDAGTLTVTGGISGGGRALTIGGSGNTTINSTAITGSGTTLTKNGSGTLTLGVSSGYTGLTTINAGIVTVQNNTGLGTTASGTTVASGAALQIDGSSLAIGDTLTIIGSGISSGGALRNLANNNTYSGAITLGTGGATIASDAGTLSINSISGTQNLIVSGSGNTGFSSINTGTGTITKNGTGLLSLSQANGVGNTGAITVNAGTLSLSQSNAVANRSSVTFGSGAAFSFSGSNLNVPSNLIFQDNSSIIQPSGGTNTLSGNLSMTGTVAINIPAASAFLVITGIISGSNIIINKGGDPTGTLFLQGNNTYTGSTNITSGTLTVGNSSGLGSSTVTVSSGAIINDSGSNLTIPNTINMQSGAILSNGSSSTNNAWSGNIILNSNNVVSGTNTFTINASTSNLLTISGLISSGTNGVTLSKGGVSGGTLVLTNSNTYAGSTNITAGTLQAQNNNALGSSANTITITNGAAFSLSGSGLFIPQAFTINGSGISSSGVIVDASTSGSNTLTGNILLNSASSIGVTNSAVALNLSGAVSGAFNLTKVGSGVLNLSGSNSAYANTITVSAGTLQASNAAALGTTGNGVTVSSGATLDINGVAIGAEPVNISGTGVGGNGALTGTNTSSLSGNITLAANTTMGGSGSLTLSGIINDGASTFSLTKTGSGTVILSNANTFDGGVNINAGTLAIGNNSALGTGAVSVSSGDTLQLNGTSLVVGNNMTLTNAALIDSNIGSSNRLSGGITLSGTNTLTIDNINNSTLTLSGVMSGSGTLNKSGQGLLILSNANTFTGNMNINEGAVNLQNSAGLGASSATASIADSAVLLLTGSSLNVPNNLTFNDGSILIENAAGNSSTLSGTVALNGSVLIGVTNPFGDNLTVSNVISGSGITLNKFGLGSLVLNGTNTFTGTTNVIAGKLELGNSAALGNNAATLTANSNTAIVINGNALNLPNNITMNDNSSLVNMNGNNTLSGSLDFSGTTYLNAANAGEILTLSGSISNSGIINLPGAGTIAVSGNNTSYAGTTNINQGTLSISTNATALGSSTININSGAVFNIANSLSGNLTNVINLAGGTFSASGTNTLATGNIALSGSNTISSSGTLTMSNVLSGSGSLSVNGSGILALSGNNSGYSGLITLSNGTLRASRSTNAFGTGLLTLAGGNLDASLTAILSNSSVSVSADATISGSNNISLPVSTLTSGANLTVNNSAITQFSITLSGGGNIIINNGIGRFTANSGSFSGAVTLTNGNLQINNNNTNPLGTGTLTLNGGTISSPVILTNPVTNTFSVGGNAAIGGTNSITFSGNGTLNSGTTLTISNTNSVTLSGSLTGSGNINIDAGTLTLAGNNTGFSAASSSSGALTVNGSSSILRISQNNALGYSTVTATGNGTLNLNNVSIGTNAITLNNGNITIDGTVNASTPITLSASSTDAINVNTAANFTLNNNINGATAGAGNLTLNGPGTMRMNGEIGNVNALASLTTNPNLTITYGGTDIITYFNQIHNGISLLVNDAKFISLFGNVTINAAVDGNQPFLVQANQGTIFLNAAIGASDPVSSFTSIGRIRLGNTNIQATGEKIFTEPVITEYPAQPPPISFISSVNKNSIDQHNLLFDVNTIIIKLNPDFRLYQSIFPELFIQFENNDLFTEFQTFISNHDFLQSKIESRLPRQREPQDS